MNRWLEFDQVEIFKNLEIWISWADNLYKEGSLWQFQIRWPDTNFNVAPEFEGKIYTSFVRGLHDARDWIRSQQPIRNPDDKLRRLERAAQTGDRSAWMQWYHELERVGQIDEFLNTISSDRIADHAMDINEAIRGFTSIYSGIEIEGRAGPLMVTAPLPFRRALDLVDLHGENLYYISPKGHYGKIGHSELAMHQRVAGNEITQFFLLGGHYTLPPEQAKRVQSVAVESINEDGGVEISEGSPGELLSDEIRRQLGFGKEQIPELTPDHQPMLMYKLRVTDRNDIYRATIEIYHYLRDNLLYRSFIGDNYEHTRLLPLIDQVLIEQHGYLEA